MEPTPEGSEGSRSYSQTFGSPVSKLRPFPMTRAAAIALSPRSFAPFEAQSDEECAADGADVEVESDVAHPRCRESIRGAHLAKAARDAQKYVPGAAFAIS